MSDHENSTESASIDAEALFQPLLPQLSKWLNAEGFVPSQNANHSHVFSRQKNGFTERFVFKRSPESSAGGDWKFEIVAGIEFADLLPERRWVVIPDCHARLGLDELVPESPRYFTCNQNTDWPTMAEQITKFIAVASPELERKSKPLRFRYLSSIESRGQNSMTRLQARVEQYRTGDLFEIVEYARHKGQFPNDLNFFEIALGVLRREGPATEEIERLDFVEDTASHDHRPRERLSHLFAQKASAIDDELRLAFGGPDESGEHDHPLIPFHDVLYFASWRIGGRWVYVASTHEGREQPYQLIIAAIDYSGLRNT